MDKQELSAFVTERSAKCNILVVGDVMLDKYYYGEVNRISPEAPVPITHVTSQKETLGGAANVAHNLARLGCRTSIAGYVGEDVENILLKLIQAADFDIQKAERGIIYIDAIDKISRKSENPSLTRDVSGEGVQQALLKLIEGTLSNVPPQGGRKHPQQEVIQIDTKNILFIF